MRKLLNFKSEILISIITLAILSLFILPIFNFNYFSYFNYFLPIRNIVATILFILLMVLKNTRKVNMIVLLSRFEIRELVFSYSYYLSTTLLFLLIIYLKYLNFMLISVIICLEIAIIITNYYAAYSMQVTRDITKYIKVKEVTYTLMMTVIFLNNFPFEIYGIPMNIILVIIYAIIQVNIIYKLLK